jgi:hypothetical protein
MDSSVTYTITRYGVPYAAGHYRQTGEFVQVFPVKRVYRDKTMWLRVWSIFGDETIEARWRRPTVSTKH